MTFKFGLKEKLGLKESCAVEAVCRGNGENSNSTELSKYAWKPKESNKVHNINRSIHRRAAAHTNKSKRCKLCLGEKLAIIRTDKSRSLNKRSELVPKCRHENIFFLRNFTPTVA